jgi:hypothetical protein
MQRQEVWIHTIGGGGVWDDQAQACFDFVCAPHDALHVILMLGKIPEPTVLRERACALSVER